MTQPTPAPSATNAAPSGLRRGLALLLRGWDFLTLPGPSVVEVGERRLARLLAVFSLLFALLNGIGILATLGVNQSFTDSGFLTLVGLTVAALVAYVLSRGRYHRIGAWLLVWSLAISGFILLPFSDDPASAIYSTVVLAYAMGTVLLSVPAMSALVVVTVFGLFLMPAFFPQQLPPDVAGTIAGNTMTVGIVLAVLAGFREGVEKSRLQEIRQANDELRRFSQSLEQRVTERTRELELASQLGRRLAQERDLDRLLNAAVQLIQQSFGMYYTQIYLLDPSGRALVLRSGTGEVAAELIRRGHRLEVGLGSINGRVALERRPVFVANTTGSSIFRPNPLLPLTRSEAAVPLISSEQLVGVLDMQSAVAGAFSEENMGIFEALAGQLATAIDNAALLRRLAQTQQQQDEVVRLETGRGWAEYLDAIERGETFSLSYQTGENVSAPLAELQAPIEVAGAAIGALRFERPASDWSEDERQFVQAAAERIGRQLDAIRLLEQAESYRRQAEDAVRRQQRLGWEEYLQGRVAQTGSGLDFEYDRIQVRPVDSNQPPEQPLDDAALPDDLPLTADAPLTDDEEHTALSFPLQLAGETLGELNFAGLDDLDAAQTEMVLAVIDRLAGHIENLRLAEQTRLALASTEALYSGSERVVRSASYDQNLAALVESTAVRRFERASIMLYNREWRTDAGDQGVPESGQIVATWERSGGNARIPIGVAYPLRLMDGAGFLNPDQPTFIPDVQHALISPEIRAAISPLGRSVALFPMVAGDQWIGMLTVASDEPVKLSEAELRQVQSLVRQAAAVLQGLRLLEQSRARAQREQMLRQVAERVRGAADIERVLQTAAREVGEALGRNVTIRLTALGEHTPPDSLPEVIGGA